METLEQYYPEPDDYYYKHGLWKFELEYKKQKSYDFDLDLSILEAKYDWLKKLRGQNERTSRNKKS